MLNLDHITVGAWEMNCYRLSDSVSNQALLIDPGDDAEKILEWLGGFQVERILITHGDRDHVGALDKVRKATGAPVGVHPQDTERFNLQADFPLLNGISLDFGGYDLRIVHIPGHTPGSVALYLPEGSATPLAIVGDAIFPGGPGRTRSHQALLTSLEALARTVFQWPDDTVLYPGHGRPTIVGAERESFQEFQKQPLPPDLFGDITWRTV